MADILFFLFRATFVGDYVRLYISFVRRVAFSYPDDDNRRGCLSLGIWVYASFTYFYYLVVRTGMVQSSLLFRCIR